MAYIICEKRRGNPKINVEVCRRKCDFTEECRPYKRYLKDTAVEDNTGVEAHSVFQPHDGGVAGGIQVT